jgi:hypothetical protein
VKPKTGTTSNPANHKSSVDKTRRPQRVETTNHIHGLSLSRLVSMTNTSVLGVSPAVTMTGTYLGMALASQLGYFSSVSRYQNQSMASLAATVGAIKHLQKSRKTQNKPPLQTPAPNEPSTNNQDPEYAMRLAEEKMHECESLPTSTNF